MRQVNLPPGCESLKMEDGTTYNGRPGGRVTVDDQHGDAIARTLGGDAGLVGSGRFGMFLGTRKGRYCEGCHRVWQAWSHECPRCAAPTVSTDPQVAEAELAKGAPVDSLEDDGELTLAEVEEQHARHNRELKAALDALAGEGAEIAPTRDAGPEPNRGSRPVRPYCLPGGLYPLSAAGPDQSESTGA